MHQKKFYFKENDIISASEIGQFHFCSISWFLQKCGYSPQSPLLDVGLKEHKKIGNVIDNLEIREKRSKYISLFGYLLLILAFIIFLFEVIL